MPIGLARSPTGPRTNLGATCQEVMLIEVVLCFVKVYVDGDEACAEACLYFQDKLVKGLEIAQIQSDSIYCVSLANIIIRLIVTS